jgi:hypothetical protein
MPVPVDLWTARRMISEVKVTTRVSHQLRRAPNNSDYLMVIRSLCRELGKPIETIWVKGHQDNDIHTKHSARPRNTTSTSTPWLHSIGIVCRVHLKLKRNTLRRNYSCSLSKAPEYSTKVDEHIRYHVNGYYIRQYMQSKNRWTDKTWTKVNMPALSRYKCQLQPKDQHWMIKLIHNQLPLGKKRAHVSQVSDVNLQMCPCCLRLSEDHHHFLHCGKNPNYKSSWSGLVTSLTEIGQDTIGTSLTLRS